MNIVEAVRVAKNGGKVRPVQWKGSETRKNAYMFYDADKGYLAIKEDIGILRADFSVRSFEYEWEVVE